MSIQFTDHSINGFIPKTRNRRVGCSEDFDFNGIYLEAILEALNCVDTRGVSEGTVVSLCCTRVQ